MATAAIVQLTPKFSGVFSGADHNDGSSTTASFLLQENHDNHHIFFDPEGFHNHLAHHLFTMYSLGANPTQLREAYERNKDCQRPLAPIDEETVQAMSDPSKFQTFMGEEKYFHDWEAFFQREIDNNTQGWRGVLQKHLLSRTPNADALFVRMYAGFLHPLIHLGFGIEFLQPAIIVEALAQAAIHSGWIGPYLLKAEQRAQASVESGSISIVSLLDAIRNHKTLATAANWSDGNKIRDGILARTPEEMIAIASQYHLPQDITHSNLRKATAEMINANAYFTACSQFPSKKPKFDFYFMHCMNCSIFFSAFLDPQHDAWLNMEDKKRLLEFKVRLDLAMYASRRAPQLYLDRVNEYSSKNHEGQGWDEIFAVVNAYEEDAHASKLIRAVGNGNRVSKEYEGGDDVSFMIQGITWLKIARMAMDSLEDLEKDERRWVRSAGFEEAWKNVPYSKVEISRA